MLRSLLSVFAGVVVLTVASFAIEAALDLLLLHLFPVALPTADALSTNVWARTLTFGYGFVCVGLGGYIAARLARRVPIVHALAVGIVQACLTVAAMLSPISSHASRVQWVVIATLSIPAAVVGGVIDARSPRTDRSEVIPTP